MSQNVDSEGTSKSNSSDDIKATASNTEKMNLFQLYKTGKIAGHLVDSQEQRSKSIKIKDLRTDENSSYNLKEMAPPVATESISTSKLIVSTRQKGNMVLQCIRNVFWQYSEIEPDFIMGRNVCGLFLSLKYHSTKPNYIYNRFKDMKSVYELRVLIVLVDVKDCSQAVRELCKLCISNNTTVLLAWRDEEVARYLESYKIFENKPPDILTGEKLKPDTFEGRPENEIECQNVVDFLSSIVSVNKTDARTLVEKFGSIEAIMLADFDQLKSCSGLGALKAKHIYDLFRKPFLKKSSVNTSADDVDEDGGNDDSIIGDSMP